MAKQLSPEQQRILRLISEGFEMRRSGNFNGKPSFYNAAYQSVRSLEKHGFIEFEGFPSVAHLTDVGRAAIAQPTAATTADSAAGEVDAEDAHAYGVDFGTCAVCGEQLSMDAECPNECDLEADVFTGEAVEVKPVCACCVTNDATADNGLCDNCAAFVGGLQTAHEREVERLRSKLGLAQSEIAHLQTTLASALLDVEWFETVLRRIAGAADMPKDTHQVTAMLMLSNIRFMANQALEIGQETNESGRETI